MFKNIFNYRNKRLLATLMLLLVLADNIITWIIMISVPVAAGVFAWAGFILMTTGVADKRSQAKAMFWKVFIGFVIILSAWLVVSTLLNALLKPEIRNTINIS